MSDLAHLHRYVSDDEEEEDLYFSDEENENKVKKSIDLNVTELRRPKILINNLFKSLPKSSVNTKPLDVFNNSIINEINCCSVQKNMTSNLLLMSSNRLNAFNEFNDYLLNAFNRLENENNPNISFEKWFSRLKIHFQSLILNESLDVNHLNRMLSPFRPLFEAIEHFDINGCSERFADNELIINCESAQTGDKWTQSDLTGPVVIEELFLE